MTSLRHKRAMTRIKTKRHRLTKRERIKLRLAPAVVTRPAEPVPLPSAPESRVWYALTVMPQSEDVAARALLREGFAAFNPSEIVEARGNRRLRHKRAERQRALLTSMVLVGFQGHRQDAGNGRTRIVAHAPWFNVLALERITGVVGMGDHPTPLPFANVHRLIEVSGQRGVTRNWSPMVGCAATIVHGPFREHTGKVVTLADGRARLELFGKTGVLAGHVAPLDVPETWLQEA